MEQLARSAVDGVKFSDPQWPRTISQVSQHAPAVAIPAMRAAVFLVNVGLQLGGCWSCSTRHPLNLHLGVFVSFAIPNQLVTSYLAHQGYHQTASILARETNTAVETSLDAIEARRRELHRVARPLRSSRFCIFDKTQLFGSGVAGLRAWAWQLPCQHCGDFHWRCCLMTYLRCQEPLLVCYS